LEALIAGSLDEDRSILISAHTDDCAACARELAWLRAERDLFAQRARGVPPSEVWAQIESQIAERLRSREPTPRGLRRLLTGTFRSERVQWFAAAGAALAICGMVMVSPLSPLRQRAPEPAQPLSAASGSVGDSGANRPDPVDSPSPTDGSVQSRVAVSGPIQIEVSTLSAEVEVVASPKPDEAVLTLDDSAVTSARFVPPAAGQTLWRLDFAGAGSLPEGRLRLQLPLGSRVDVRSVSGDVQIRGLKGDVAVTTTSGEITVQDAKSAKLTAVSGDLDLRDISGPIEAKTASGELKLTGELSASLRFVSVSGELTVLGPCRVAACKITAETQSGNVLLPRRAENALSIRLRSHSGELSGAEGLAVEMKRVPGQPTEWTTRLGAGTGSLELTTASGDILLDAP
jgi:hypothetical protein